MRLNKSKRFFLVSLIILGLFPFLFSSVNGLDAKVDNSIETQQTNQLKTSATSTYVIVTTQAIQSGSNNLTKFIRYKESIGFNVEVINETEYGMATGETRVFNIRDWLIANYQTMNIEYVLLIGNPIPDGTTNECIPMLMCWPRRGVVDLYDKDSPTDYIYADLTGDWDSGNGYYGEYTLDPDVDFNPEVYVGRIPVYATGPYPDLDNILWRISIHHNNSGAEKKKILLPMAISNYYNEGGDSTLARTDGLDCPYYVWNNIAKQRGMSDTVMYETEGNASVSTGAYHYYTSLTKTSFINELNDNYGAVFWWAHGDETGASRKYWTDTGDGIPQSGEMTWTSFIDSTDTINNDKPAFIFQSSCKNGAPEISNNLGYTLLKNGVAISTVSASRDSWYKTNVWYPTTAYADNTNVGYYYLYNLIRNDMSSGKALYSAKSAFSNIWGDESWQTLMDFNLYGDPALCYWEESPTPSTSAAPIDDDDDDDSSSSSNVYLDFLNENRNVILIGGLIGVGALTVVISAVISKKKRKQPSRSMAPTSQYYPPPPPLANIPSSQASQFATPLITPSSYCSKCGALLRQGSSFCVICGGKKTN